MSCISLLRVPRSLSRNYQLGTLDPFVPHIYAAATMTFSIFSRLTSDDLAPTVMLPSSDPRPSCFEILAHKIVQVVGIEYIPLGNGDHDIADDEDKADDLDSDNIPTRAEAQSSCSCSTWNDSPKNSLFLLSLRHRSTSELAR